MVVLHIVSGIEAVVLYSSLCEEISGICFLQEGITDVFLIPQKPVDVAGVPLI